MEITWRYDGYSMEMQMVFDGRAPGLQTTKNFLVANAVENILAVPKKVDNEQPRYVSKKDYGVVPAYLDDVKAAIAEEKAVLREYLEEEVQNQDGPTAIEMPERPEQGDYKRPPFNEQFFVPNLYPYKD